MASFLNTSREYGKKKRKHNVGFFFFLLLDLVNTISAATEHVLYFSPVFFFPFVYRHSYIYIYMFTYMYVYIYFLFVFFYIFIYIIAFYLFVHSPDLSFSASSYLVLCIPVRLSYSFDHVKDFKQKKRKGEFLPEPGG